MMSFLSGGLGHSPRLLYLLPAKPMQLTPHIHIT